MRYFSTLFVLFFLSSCVSYKPVIKGNIKAVYVLFKDISWYHYEGYKLYDGSTVKWDKQNAHVKAVLNSYKNRTGELPKENSGYLAHFLLNKKIINYLPIKVGPLKEFGLIETNSNEFVSYGIMEENVFIDLSHDKVYY